MAVNPLDPIFTLKPYQLDLQFRAFEDEPDRNWTCQVAFSNPNPDPAGKYDAWVQRDQFGGMKVWGMIHDELEPLNWSCRETPLVVGDLLTPPPPMPSYSLTYENWWVHPRAFVNISTMVWDGVGSTREIRAAARLFVIREDTAGGAYAVLKNEHVLSRSLSLAAENMGSKYEAAYAGFQGGDGGFMGAVHIWEIVDPDGGSTTWTRQLHLANITIDSGNPSEPRMLDLELSSPITYDATDPHIHDPLQPFHLGYVRVGTGEFVTQTVTRNLSEVDETWVGVIDGTTFYPESELLEGPFVAAGYPARSSAQAGAGDVSTTPEDLYDLVSGSYPNTVITPYVPDAYPVELDIINSTFRNRRNFQLTGLPEMAIVRHPDSAIVGVKPDGGDWQWGIDPVTSGHSVFYPGHLVSQVKDPAASVPPFYRINYSGQPYRVADYPVTWVVVDNPDPNITMVSPVVWLPESEITGEFDFDRCRFTGNPS